MAFTSNKIWRTLSSFPVSLELVYGIWLILSKCLDLGYLQGDGTPTNSFKHIQALCCVYLLVSEKISYVSWNWLRQHTACQFHILPILGSTFHSTSNKQLFILQKSSQWYMLNKKPQNISKYSLWDSRSGTNAFFWHQPSHLHSAVDGWSHSLVSRCEWQSHAGGGGFNTSFSQPFNTAVSLPDIPFNP